MALWTVVVSLLCAESIVKLVQGIVARTLRRSRLSLSQVAGPSQAHWFKGNFHQIFQDGREFNLKLAEEYGGAVRIHGLLGNEQLLISDPRALHHVVVREQSVYEETDMFTMGNKLIFGEGLISTLGEQHRKQRKMLNPVFSLANMRALLPLIQPIADKLASGMLAEVARGGESQELDLLSWMSRGTLEYISRAGLGHSFNALDDVEPSEFVRAVKGIAPTTGKIILFRPFVPLIYRNLSLYWRNKIVDWAPLQALRDLRNIVRTMDAMSTQIFAEKKKAMIEGTLSSPTEGKDIMSVMLAANASSSESDRLRDEELLGQMNTLIFAGIETTTTALCRIFFILSTRQDVQIKLRTHIRWAKEEHASPGQDWREVELPYDVLTGLPYLDAVVRETLRVHPPTSLLSRTVRKPTVLPLQCPVRSITGEEIHAISLEPNTNVVINVLASNHNKDVWGEDASDWVPERWLTASGERIRMGKETDGELDVGDGIAPMDEMHGAPGFRNGVKYPGVYASMMTFLGGGRACIGFKFAEMEIKQVIVTLLSRMHFSPSTVVDENDVRKEIYWMVSGLQKPVVRPPHGDGQTSTLPLQARNVKEEDFTL